MFTTSMNWHMIDLPSGSLGSTMCQVPIVVVVEEGSPRVEATLSDGRVLTVEGNSLGADLSSRIFARTGDITRIQAFMPPLEGTP